MRSFSCSRRKRRQVREVIPIGHTAGIRMKSEGVLVVRLDEVESS